MKANELRRDIKRRVDELPASRLRVAADFVAYLHERDANPATRELLRIPGFGKALAKAHREVVAGRMTPVSKLLRKS